MVVGLGRVVLCTRALTDDTGWAEFPLDLLPPARRRAKAARLKNPHVVFDLSQFAKLKSSKEPVYSRKLYPQPAPLFQTTHEHHLICLLADFPVYHTVKDCGQPRRLDLATPVAGCPRKLPMRRAHQQSLTSCGCN